MTEKLANFVNCELAICQNFPRTFTDTLKMYLVYVLTVAYLPNFSLPIAFTLMISPTKIFRARYIASELDNQDTYN